MGGCVNSRKAQTTAAAVLPHKLIVELEVVVEVGLELLVMWSVRLVQNDGTIYELATQILNKNQKMYQ